MIQTVPGSVIVELLELDGIVECACLKRVNIAMGDSGWNIMLKQQLYEMAQWIKDEFQGKHGRLIEVSLTFGEAECSVTTSARKD